MEYSVCLFSQLKQMCYSFILLFKPFSFSLTFCVTFYQLLRESCVSISHFEYRFYVSSGIFVDLTLNILKLFYALQKCESLLNGVFFYIAICFLIISYTFLDINLGNFALDQYKHQAWGFRIFLMQFDSLLWIQILYTTIFHICPL